MSRKSFPNFRQPCWMKMILCQQRSSSVICLPVLQSLSFFHHVILLAPFFFTWYSYTLFPMHFLYPNSLCCAGCTSTGGPTRSCRGFPSSGGFAHQRWSLTAEAFSRGLALKRRRGFLRAAPRCRGFPPCRGFLPAAPSSRGSLPAAPRSRGFAHWGCRGFPTGLPISRALAFRRFPRCKGLPAAQRSRGFAHRRCRGFPTVLPISRALAFRRFPRCRGLPAAHRSRGFAHRRCRGFLWAAPRCRFPPAAQRSRGFAHGRCRGFLRAAPRCRFPPAAQRSRGFAHGRCRGFLRAAPRCRFPPAAQKMQRICPPRMQRIPTTPKMQRIWCLKMVLTTRTRFKPTVPC